MAINRRELVVLAATAAACACCEQMIPTAVAGPGANGGAGGGSNSGAAGGGLDIGVAGDYPADGAYDKFAKSDKIIVVRSGGKLYASSAVCTHKSCILTVASSELRCPCHRSQFGLDGAPRKGPAKAPLARYAIAKKDEHILVDTSKKFEKDKWGDEAAFVKLS